MRFCESDEIKIRFGKYRGTPIAEVLERDPGYCRWLRAQESLVESHPDVAAYLNENAFACSGSAIMRWGRHKGRSIQWIFDHDRSYIDWLFDSEFVRTKCPQIRDEIAKLDK